MTPVSITISGFRAYVKSFTFTFPKSPGFYQLRGKNGGGKSTVWDALCWCVFGMTLRGTFGPSVVSWGKKTCSVSTVLQTKSGTVVVCRTQNPNTLTVDGKTRDQDCVNGLVGFGYETFQHALVFGQFNDFFYDLQPADKLRMFSECLKLDVWEDARKATSSAAAEVEQELARVSRDMGTAQGRLTELEESANPKAVKARLADLNKEHDRLQELVEAYDGAKQSHYKFLVSKAEEGVKAADGAWEEAKTKAQNREYALKDFNKVLTNAKEDASGVRALVENTESLIRKLSKASDDAACPTCGMDLSPKHRKDAIGRQERKLEKQQEKLKALDDEVAAAKAAVDTCQIKLNQLRANADKAYRELRAQQQSLSDAQHDASKAETEHQQNHHRLGVIGLEIKEVEGSLDTLTKRQATLKAELDELAITGTKLSERLGRYTFWEEQFKQIRLWVLDSALNELRALTNTYLAQLGLVGWEVQYVVERDKKGGKGVVCGFSVMIKSPTSGDTLVPWRDWSGGETQRLRLAGACALALLLRSRLGIASDLEVWDEPTHHLDAAGVDSLLEFLAGRAKKLKRSVWLVDHRAPDRARFTSAYEVRRVSDTSTIAKID